MPDGTIIQIAGNNVAVTELPAVTVGALVTDMQVIEVIDETNNNNIQTLQIPNTQIVIEVADTIQQISITPNETTAVEIMPSVIYVPYVGTGDKNFIYTQNTPSTLWTITHNLGKYPSISAIDSAGTQVFGEVKYLSLNQLTISFGWAFSGKASLN
ncbi:MAG: hypothetical protein HXX20_02270 [Chloroflexi bacterium]|nr:hypothetical protein [Chloroflexota bacterium]